jgi:putative transposase
VPETITIDGSEASAAAIKSYNEEYGTVMALRQVRYLNNMVEQDHRTVKRVVRPMRGFKSCETVQRTLVGIEVLHMLKKGRLVTEEEEPCLTPAEQFCALAASSQAPKGFLHPPVKFATDPPGALMSCDLISLVERIGKSSAPRL